MDVFLPEIGRNVDMGQEVMEFIFVCSKIVTEVGKSKNME